MSNTKSINRNTGWYGLENLVNSVLTLITSIAIARSLGPSKMGYIIYVFWTASVISSLGSPATTQKYMAEFIGKGDGRTARYIDSPTMMLQIGMATIATGGILFCILKDAAVGYRLASAIIALSIWPAMVNFILAQANVATENLSTNLPASQISIFAFFVAILAAVLPKVRSDKYFNGI